LIVEDYAPIRESVAQGLREAGYAVDAAANGTDGHWLATSNPYDVILLDLMLPGMSGITILELLRAAGNRSYILVLTAKDQIEDRVRGLNAGADDYLVKPFAFEELLARVRSLVRRRYDVFTAKLRVGDLQLDPATKLVERGGTQIALTAREFSLLEYLMARAGQVVSRSEIWEHLYDFNDESQSNVVDVYVGYLRKKLESKGAKLIHTRRGHGYVIAESLP
jgi:DNA-binding response OmpR family regulator